MLNRDIVRWLTETDAAALADLYREADRVRQLNVGDQVHLRGLVEISNVCARQCAYCGLRAPNRKLTRYTMPADEILQAAQAAFGLGYGTVVIQAGESEALGAEWVAGVVRAIKSQMPLAVTLSLGERSLDDLALWRKAGADRYLLRFETSDAELFRRIHPPVPGGVADRIELLRGLRALGYEVGSGVMIGIPGQSYDSLARDIELFRELDLDMIGVGPFLPHPDTPLGSGPPLPDGRGSDRGHDREGVVGTEQVPNTEEMVYKVLALTRLVRPDANIPSTTALATINTINGRELGLARGANVVMPNLTPMRYRRHYEIYPNKACINERPSDCSRCLRGRIVSMGRLPGAGPGGRRREVVHV
jgi:biotin synthase